MFIPLSDSNALKHIKLQYVTLGIIAVNCLIWLIVGTPAIFGPEAVRATNFGFGFIPAVVNGYQILPPELEQINEQFTYVTYAFFHGDFMHLAGNMLFVWVFGDNIEDAMGHWRFLFFYLACAIAGAIAHSMVDPQSAAPLIGASGAAAGIVGAYLLLHPKIRIWVLALGRIPLRIPAVFVLGAWIAFQFYQFATDPDGQVSWAAHVGGIVAGMVLILFLKRSDVALFDRDVDVVIPTPDIVKENINVATPVEDIDGVAARKTSRASSSDVSRGSSVPKAGTRKKINWGRKLR